MHPLPSLPLLCLFLPLSCPFFLVPSLPCLPLTVHPDVNTLRSGTAEQELLLPGHAEQELVRLDSGVGVIVCLGNLPSLRLLQRHAHAGISNAVRAAWSAEWMYALLAVPCAHCQASMQHTCMAGHPTHEFRDKYQNWEDTI
ncbi:hypothetical protein C8Q70DRAFT_938077 [Cubamyces menziesii]|nr:hypothetical protein C8Q70DRAFT_938077 [Cubamyces menziesii]